MCHADLLILITVNMCKRCMFILVFSLILLIKNEQRLLKVENSGGELTKKKNIEDKFILEKAKAQNSLVDRLEATSKS